MSAIFETSIILARESEGHSRNVSRRRFDVTTVKGPFGVLSVCFVYRRINDFIRVVFPTCRKNRELSGLFLFLLLGELSCLREGIEKTYSWRSNNGNYKRRSLLWKAIDERHMQSLFLNLNKQY